jgi:hypothetical protein
VLNSVELVTGFLGNIHNGNLCIYIFIEIDIGANACQPETNDMCARKLHTEGQYVETY